MDEMECKVDIRCTVGTELTPLWYASIQFSSKLQSYFPTRPIAAAGSQSSLSEQAKPTQNNAFLLSPKVLS